MVSVKSYIIIYGLKKYTLCSKEVRDLTWCVSYNFIKPIGEKKKMRLVTSPQTSGVELKNELN